MCCKWFASGMLQLTCITSNAALCKQAAVLLHGVSCYFFLCVHGGRQKHSANHSSSVVLTGAAAYCSSTQRMDCCPRKWQGITLPRHDIGSTGSTQLPGAMPAESAISASAHAMLHSSVMYFCTAPRPFVHAQRICSIIMLWVKPALPACRLT